jgi:hypothetical protein
MGCFFILIPAVFPSNAAKRQGDAKRLSEACRPTLHPPLPVELKYMSKKAAAVCKD